ncbi:MAG: IMP dehydrogenase [Parcubacteria group bacterium CG1_02_37_51]|uniref:Inosine-5'-monophosphate dehydrogenase n=2 Tax=Candidatus Komeiliibacteriota TaxID=1817908 RepID=A0A2M8DS83_9BACT|nr:MAG: IMP dehydrogenase [Parcubacteria group bacterium CG1_02_37_51]PIY94873.1 MAG: IMP dehydrogenase [Candidatus Komeilibacteria bacterium CG_4_10_14_0_8_um_filter_37_78]PJC02247.1 MAG: IMP dehydrogenase [Candidatus Komeilibacteria bacterium CG_4_9_14_0_8_um_filter_36_9]
MDKIYTALSYDDVLLVPQYSDIVSRQDVDTSTWLTRKIKLNIPILSANMDTVTEHRMAMAVARMGGAGVIHRFLPINRQVDEVKKVKRSESLIIEHPYTIKPQSTIQELNHLRTQYNVSGFLVVDEDGYLQGIVTRRDTLFINGDQKYVQDVMTPLKSLITAQKGISSKEAQTLLAKNKIEKLPLIDERGRLEGLITTTDIEKRDKYPMAVKDRTGKLIVGAAIGVKDDVLERSEALIKAGVDFLVVDIAHGHAISALQTVQKVKSSFPEIDIIGGNVASAQAVKDLIKAGVDAVKVGVGPGSTCITRIVTGSGVPQLTAVMNCARAGKKYNIPIIADGGLRTSGDITKAIAAGADCILSGNLFAGTEETPGIVVYKDGQQYKIYRGMASFGATAGRKEAEKGDWEDNSLDNVVPEGVESLISLRGPVTEVVKQLVGGFRSGMSYSGARTIKELQQKAQFVRITPGGQRESSHHDVIKL